MRLSAGAFGFVSMSLPPFQAFIRISTAVPERPRSHGSFQATRRVLLQSAQDYGNRDTITGKDRGDPEKTRAAGRPRGSPRDYREQEAGASLLEGEEKGR